MKKLILLALSATMFAPLNGAADAATASAIAPAQQMFDVTLVVRSSDQIIAEPHLRVMAGEAARIAIAPGDGSYFQMDFAVSPGRSGQLTIVASVDAGMASATNRATLRAAPQLSVLPGQSASIVVGNEADGVGTYRTDFVIRPVTS